MMYLFLVVYNFLLLLSIPILFFLSLFNKKLTLILKNQFGLLNRIKKTLNGNQKVIWIHCASLGEFEQGRPIIESLKKEYPEYYILLTFFSPSGFEIRKNYEFADGIYYLPFDFLWNTNRFLTIVKPKYIFFIKYEFWPSYLWVIQQKNIKCYLASGVFTEQKSFFKWYGWPFRKLLGAFHTLFVQDANSKLLLANYNIHNTIIAGDTRFDRVLNIANNRRELSPIQAYCKNAKILIAGSTWLADEHLLIDAIQELGPNYKLILAPHEISSAHIIEIEKLALGQSIRLSQYIASPKNLNILIIDNIGMLSSLYYYAHFCYIGGGFSAGIHNALEAAVYGKPIFFGPNYLKFIEATDLVAIGVAKAIKSKTEIVDSITTLSKNGILYETICNNSKSYVKNKAGATNKILNFCLSE